MLPVLCWDIDGTLLTTARAGIGAWEEAHAEVLGAPRDLGEYRTAGLTDVEIGRALIEDAGRGSEAAALLGPLVARYESLLPVHLPSRQGRVMPNVREFLEWNRAHARLTCLLLTGNTQGGAKAKLEHYGLAGYFGPGAFSSLERADRTSVARRACELASELVEGFDAARMVVIGDTPHDVACGLAVGARALAVATGGYSVEELERAGAWKAIAQLPPPPELMALLG